MDNKLVPLLIDEELSEQDELFLMANLPSRLTGLPFIVWISTGYGVRHDIRVKVARGKRVRPSEMTSVALRPTVHVISGELTSDELKQLTEWVHLNWNVLLQFWEEELDTDEALGKLKRL